MQTYNYGYVTCRCCNNIVDEKDLTGTWSGSDRIYACPVCKSVVKVYRNERPNERFIIKKQSTRSIAS